VSPAESAAGAVGSSCTEEFSAAIAEARERVAAVLVPACPTTSFLAALRDEVERAIITPDAVPYPELADPDAYWAATVRPQARHSRRAVSEIVTWLEERIVGLMGSVETELKDLVDEAGAGSSVNLAEARARVSEQVEARCSELSAWMEQVRTLLPDDRSYVEAREAATEAIRARATADVEGLRGAYLRDAGGDEAHQRYAAEQWEATFGERVAHRESMLVGQAPWRHQELALVGYERARAECLRMVEEATARLQAPLARFPALLLERFDGSVGSVA
jgi:hypothetical protein